MLPAVQNVEQLHFKGNILSFNARKALQKSNTNYQNYYYQKEIYKRYTPAKFPENGSLLPKTSYPLHENKEVYLVYFHSVQKPLEYGVY